MGDGCLEKAVPERREGSLGFLPAQNIHGVETMYCEDKLEHVYVEPSATHEISKFKTFSLEARGCVNIFYQRGRKAAQSSLPLRQVATCKGGPYVNIYFVLLTGKKPNFKHQESKIVTLVYSFAHITCGLAVLFQGKMGM